MKILETNSKDGQSVLEKRNDNGAYSVSKIKADFEDFTDQQIWSRFRAGDRDAFVYIYYSYYPVLYNYGRQLSSETELIEDCIQEVFIDIHNAHSRLSGTSSIKFYLMKSLKTRYLRTIKNTSRVKRNEQFYSGYEFKFTMSAEEKIINAQLNREILKKLNLALDTLTHKQREVIYYFYYENLSVDEIAAIMSVKNRRSIQNMIYRSISFLRDHIEI